MQNFQFFVPCFWCVVPHVCSSKSLQKGEKRRSRLSSCCGSSERSQPPHQAHCADGRPLRRKKHRTHARGRVSARTRLQCVFGAGSGHANDERGSELCRLHQRPAHRHTGRTLQSAAQLGGLVLRHCKAKRRQGEKHESKGDSSHIAICFFFLSFFLC